MGRSRWRGPALLLLVAAGACANVQAPRTKVLAPLDPSLDRVLYVTTDRAREDVLAALKQAGFTIATDARQTSIMLEVRLGGVRDRSPRCGKLRNVSYGLRQGGILIAVIKGRGWTGASCRPNVFDQMNGTLAQLFGPGSAPAGGEGAEPRPGNAGPDGADSARGSARPGG
jgi:hypothetical protein